MKIRRAIPLGLALVIGAILIMSQHIPADDTKPPEAADAAPAEEHPVMRIYDVRGLARTPADFTFDNSPQAGGFISPGILNPNSSYGYQGNHGAQIEPTTLAPTRAESMETITKLIQDTVAPDSWRDAGGTVGALRQIDGLLVISQTPTNHKLIAELLRETESFRDETVQATAEWVIVSRAQAGQLLKSNPAGRASAGSLLTVDIAAIDALPAGIRRSRARLICTNGQTVNFVSGREQTVTVSEVATVGTAVSAYTPVVTNIGSGIALQLNPVVYREQKSAVVTLLSTFTNPDKPGKPIAIRAYATTQASTGENIVAEEATATYRPVGGVVQELRTTARIPLGVPVLIGEMSLEPNARDGQDLEMLLILTVRAG